MDYRSFVTVCDRFVSYRSVRNRSEVFGTVFKKSWDLQASGNLNMTAEWTLYLYLKQTELQTGFQCDTARTNTLLGLENIA